MVDHPTVMHLLDSNRPRAEVVSAGLRPAKSASELVRYAETVFGDADKAERWLSKPKVFLDGKTPRGVMDSPSGREKIDEMLVRIEYGMIG
jgi:uncharacterized protein (DUF2384 family)